MTKDNDITSPGAGDAAPSKEGRALWRMARQGTIVPPGTAPDEAESANLLAGYLDGSLDKAACERVEAWLAADPTALDGLIAAREALGAEVTASPTLIARAQGLVRERPAEARGGVMSRLRQFLIPEAPLWQPVGLAAALLLACVVGFELGEEGYTSLLADQETQVADLGAAEGGFDLAASSDDLF